MILGSLAPRLTRFPLWRMCSLPLAAARLGSLALLAGVQGYHTAGFSISCKQHCTGSRKTSSPSFRPLRLEQRKTHRHPTVQVWALKPDGLVSSHLFFDMLCGMLQLYSEDCKRLLMEGVWYIVWLLFCRRKFPVLIARSQITTLSLNIDHKYSVNISVLPL